MLQVHGERLADILLTEQEKQSGDGRLVSSERDRFDPRIEIRDLAFRYSEHDPLVLDGIDLVIEPGESVAITGPSGCGKSTLMHVLLGVLPPTAGDVLFGGVSIRNMDPQVLRTSVASVTQNDTLFAGSLSDNICFFDSQADQQWIEQCAKMASIHDEIAAMPMGYNTFIGDMGSALSGGQQQRVLLARALYQKPKVLILDEATSHLDLRRESMVSAAIHSLEITRIIVAHRPQTAEHADRIILLDRGRVASERRIAPGIAVVKM
jgi:ATP-binding cassette, subfamily B, bacterial CvaB/MchF/RaxB